jgi:membrane-associated phospholipid phosphatase
MAVEDNDKVNAIPDEIRKSPNLPWLIIFLGFVLSSFLLWLFAELAGDMMEPQVIKFDKSVTDYLHSFHNTWLRQFMFWITESGSLIWISAFSIITIYWLLRYKKDKLSIIFFIITVAGGGLLNYILKLFFQRVRPELDPTIGALGFSFPSGHSMGSMVFYGFIGYLIIRSERSNLSKSIFSIILFLFILLIGISRIYLNAHFPSDVIAGFAAGMLWLILNISALRLFKWQKKRKNEETGD